MGVILDSKTIYKVTMCSYFCAAIVILLWAAYKFLTWENAPSEPRWKLYR